MTEKEKMVLRAINRLIAQGKLILEKGPDGEPVVRLPKETKI